jgi:predicted metal-dependent enzyme (double-stranded beta helix superfamily)
MELLRLQMDRLSKLMSTLSNILKKASDTATGLRWISYLAAQYWWLSYRVVGDGGRRLRR